MRRRPFLLLEVMIAVALIGVFSFVSLQGLYRTLGIQRKMVHALEYKRVIDLERMTLVERYWGQVEGLAKDKKIISEKLESKTPFQIQCQSHSEGCYLLTVKEQRPKEFRLTNDSKYIYHYLISR